MKSLLNPKSIAVIGVSRDPEKIGYLIFDSLLSGYGGKVYGVNPSAESILGQTIYPTIFEIEADVEMAVIAVPAKIVPKVLESCGKKGVQVAIIITAGFSEAGSRGKEEEAELLRIAKKFGMRLLGPNCLGVINNFKNLNASFATASLPAKYRVGIFSQSGAMGAAMLDFANGTSFGFSYFVSLGNKIDISEIDLLESWTDDDSVDVAVGYLEDVKNGSEFMAAARKFTAKKPLIILKGGTTAAGSAAAHLHTSAMLQDDIVFWAALKECGVTIAKNLNDLFELAVSFSQNPLPHGKRLAIISNAGGPSVLTADACAHETVELAKLSAHTIAELSRQTAAASVANPIDLRGDAKSRDFKTALKLCQSDPGVDGIMLLATPQAMTEIELIAWEAVNSHRTGSKPIYVNFIGGELIEKAETICQGNGVPTFSYPERAVRAFAFQADFQKRRKTADNKSVRHKSYYAARSIINFAAGQINSVKLASLLRLYGVPMAQTVVAKTAKEAAAALKTIKPPVVMKILSPDILHKTDVGGVILGVNTEAEAEAAFNKITQNIKKNLPKARIEGITVMETAKEGLELIIGVKRDPSFGPVVMFGFGGIFVELIADFSITLAPFTEEKIRQMIRETAVSKIISGYRTGNRLSEGKLIKAILGLAQLLTDHPEITQIEINPLVMADDGRGIMGLDAKVETSVSHDKID